MAGFGLYHLLILRLLINFNITDKTKLHNLIFLGLTRLKAPTAQEVISFIRTKKGVRSLFIDEKINELISFGLIDEDLQVKDKGREVYYKLVSALKYQPLLRNCVEISLARYDNLESINEEVNSFLPVRKKSPGEKVSLVKIWGY
ncbi:hypothetical protein [Natranaerofaba carboxydovora]|uniref:hypothetical protein n=1 Tax=Natranaerofaba carboxydovora TaxID=2742683 RepID=UPI001F12D80A|nr:hypothetical protein [Natranaerofaba carboxydovora]UMZ73060.1 hypothetical protein ACONDI_00606 [Natranaerofaba carboxydovora]